MEILNYLLTNMLIPFVIGGIGAYAYPKIESYLKNRTLSSRERKIKEIRSEHLLVKSYKEDRTRLIADMLFWIVMGLVWLLFLLFLIAMLMMGMITAYANTPLSQSKRMVIDGFIFGLIGLFGYQFFYAHDFLMRVARMYIGTFNYSKYHNETKAKIIKLGGNPEDLDKEETAGG